MTRKQLVLQNLGKAMVVAAVQDYPGISAAHTNTTLVDRMLKELLRVEFDLLATDRARAEAYMRHFFYGTIGETESKKLLDYIVAKPPNVTISYPRTSAEMPCIAVVTENEEQSEKLLGDDVGETSEDEATSDTADFRGSFFNCSYGIWIYAEHPDVCAYLYQIAKMILVGSQRELEQNGFLETKISGTELVPNPELLPENMFVRTLRISGKALTSVPEWTRDPGKFQARVFADDVVVDGLRGGVSSYDPESGS